MLFKKKAKLILFLAFFTIVYRYKAYRLAIIINSLALSSNFNAIGLNNFDKIKYIYNYKYFKLIIRFKNKYLSCLFKNRGYIYKILTYIYFK